MTTAVCNTRTKPHPNRSSPATEGNSTSVVLVVHMDRFLKLATRYALTNTTPPHPSDSSRRKHMLRPANMQEARARDNRADYEDVLRTAGSAVAAKLFHAAKMVKIHPGTQQKNWKDKKTQCQWAGCPSRIRTKHDMRLEEKRRKLREKQLAIPAWDTRMTAALHRCGWRTP